jgi:DNA (cytosine-5)-methyltransferase 1
MGKREVADPRNNLVFEWGRLVVEMKPKAVCMENVPGILSMVTTDGRSVLDELCAILERGSFGEFEAMRSLLAGGNRKVIRNKPKPLEQPKRASKSHPSDERQTSLFDQ